MTTPSLDLYDFPQPQLAELIGSWGFRPAHAARVWKYLYRDLSGDIAAMHDLPVRLRDRLLADARLTPLTTARSALSDDARTRKLLLALGDQRQIETVLMHLPRRATACLSTQVGCALACVFCATGQAGFTRNLSAGEIAAQAVHVSRLLRNSPRIQERESAPAAAPRLRNLVLMGMGEPLLNYDAVMRALDILRDPAGLSIGNKQITISTVGVVPGIVRLADEARPYSLAVSLHAATQAERAALVPSARTWPLDDLLAACRYYSDKTGRRILFEWTLIQGENDSVEQAHALAGLLRGMQAQVNLIPLNATVGYDGSAGSSTALDRFYAVLSQQGIAVSVRRRRGIDIAAGCGQLAASGTP